MTPAYHSVTGGAWTLDILLRRGVIQPAIRRVSCAVMKAECFGREGIAAKWPDADKNALAALEQLAREELKRCRQESSEESDGGAFTCLDLIAGDLDYVFLSIGEWYGCPEGGSNGFVFDAEKLIRAGALFRSSDLLGHYQSDVEVAISLRYDDVTHARGVLEGMLQESLRQQRRGAEALHELEYGDWGRGSGAELVWRGDLPVANAQEIWREGRQLMKPKAKARAR